MKAIYKYNVCKAFYGGSVNEVEIPYESKFLNVGIQGDEVYAWYMVDLDRPSKAKHIWFQIGTGHQIGDDSKLGEFRGTVMYGNGALVWHMFELKVEA